jgi:hypothetical protein
MLLAQVPQGFTYQAVATDNNGLELVTQSISVRVSILSESSTGVEQWIETHSTTTDGFGLFTITIGEGTSTGNGAQSSFSDIDWGASVHYLKIEMDVNGGSEYQLLGISQLMSVPYALYSNSTQQAINLINSQNLQIDSLDNLLNELISTIDLFTTNSSNSDNYLLSELSIELNLSDAMSYCRNLSEDGYSDWYLPSLEELFSIYSGKMPANITEITGTIWTRSPNPFNKLDGGGWAMNSFGLSSHSYGDAHYSQELKTLCIHKL